MRDEGMRDEGRWSPFILHPSAFILHHYMVPIPWLVTSVVLIALAVVILIRQKGSRVARLFCLMITLVAIWFGGFAGMLATSNATTAFLFAKIGLAAIAVLPAA